MKRPGDVGVKVLLAESPSCRLSLKVPFLPINDENAGTMQWSKYIPDELSPYIILAIMFLDVLKVGWMIDDVQPKEGEGHLICRSVSLVQRIPSFTASATIRLELLRIACEGFSQWSRNPF